MTMFNHSNGEWDDVCQVRIGEGSIAVSYFSDGQQIVYDGLEEKAGHFRLRSQTVNGRATLHRFDENDDMLEGSWFEAGYQGMWRIQLDD